MTRATAAKMAAGVAANGAAAPGVNVAGSVSAKPLHTLVTATTIGELAPRVGIDTRASLDG